MLTIAKLNERHSAFWNAELLLAQQRMANKAVLQTALVTLDSKLRMGVPVRNQKSFYVALREAEEAGHRFLPRFDGDNDAPPLKNSVVELTEISEPSAPGDKVELLARNAQRERARKPRVKVLPDGTTITQLVTNFLRRPGNLEKSAKVLWREFFSVLEEQGLSPKALQGRAVYEYKFGNEPRALSSKTCANRRSRLRKNGSH